MNEALTPLDAVVSCQRMGIRVSIESKAQFAAKLKLWREREGLTQAQAAKVLLVPVRTLQNWEIARTKPASLAERLILAVIDPPPKRKRRKRV